MTSSVSYLTQSKYYSPAFNGAIFDGPMRIYFAQYQEGEALKIYFALQKFLENDLGPSKDVLKEVGRHMFVMLYPSEESFDRSFEEGYGAGEVVVESLGDDVVIGIRGPVNELCHARILQEAQRVLHNWDTLRPTRPEVDGPTL